ncbi:MAG: transcription antitermination factor NusB [Rhodospirillaceae bacterium]
MTTTSKPARRRTRTGSGSAKARRSAARLAAVQALYQIDLAGAAPETVLAEFVNHRLGHEVDGVSYVAADPELFSAIVRGTSGRRGDIDPMLSAALDAKIPLDRLELLLRAILRAGVFELLAHGDIQPPIVIAEYIEVAKAFYAGREPGVVNAVLDHLARRLRDGEGMEPEPAPRPDHEPG